MDQLSSLTSFVQAAETGSFVKAGNKIGISASAVGKAIARLEARLGVRLFHRSTRSITLTSEGQLFLKRCRKIFHEIESAENELVQSKAGPHGKLKVSMPLVGMLLMPVITEFMKKYPEIVLDLDFNDKLVDVIDEGFDVVIRTGEATDSRLKSKILGTFKYQLVGSPDYFKLHGYPKKPNDLLHHKCFHYKFSSTGKLESWPLAINKNGPAIQIPQSSIATVLDPLIAMATQGLGIASLPNFAVRNEIKKGLLVTVMDKHLQKMGTFRALWPASKYQSPKRQVFIEFLLENIELTK